MTLIPVDFRRRCRRDAYDLYEAGVAADSRGDYDAARVHYELALQLDPRLAEAWCDLGSLLHGLGSVATAAAHYKRAIECNPNMYEAHYNLGCCAMSCELWRSAEAALRRAIECKPTYSNAHYNLAMTLERLRRPFPAIAAYRQFLRYAHPSDFYLESAKRRIARLEGR